MIKQVDRASQWSRQSPTSGAAKAAKMTLADATVSW